MLNVYALDDRYASLPFASYRLFIASKLTCSQRTTFSPLQWCNFSRFSFIYTCTQLNHRWMTNTRPSIKKEVKNFLQLNPVLCRINRLLTSSLSPRKWDFRVLLFFINNSKPLLIHTIKTASFLEFYIAYLHNHLSPSPTAQLVLLHC